MKNSSSIEIVLNFTLNNESNKEKVEQLIKDIIIENPCISPLFDYITIENDMSLENIKKIETCASI